MTFNKKYLYIMLGATVALTSCSNDDEVKVPSLDRTISFGSYVGRPSARGLVTDISGLEASTEGFGVFANHDDASDYASGSKIPNFMYNQQVVHSGIGWTYSPLKYWPSSASEKISFFAYAPYIQNATAVGADATAITAMSGNADAGDPNITFEIGSDVAAHTDLLYAKAVDQTNTVGTVSLEFKHALSRIGFKISGWNDDGSGTTFDNNTKVTVNAVTLSTTRRGATLNLNTGAWSNAIDTETFAYTLSGSLLQNNELRAGDQQGKQLNTDDGYIMILPDLSADGKSERFCLLVDYTVETYDPALAGGRLVVRNKIYRYIQPGFEQGKAYTINIHLGMASNGGDDDADDDPNPDDPTPVDPNPEDPTIPTPPGSGSYVDFSATMSDWGSANAISVPLVK